MCKVMNELIYTLVLKCGFVTEMAKRTKIHVQK